MVYENNKGGEYAHLFVQELQEPENMMTPEFEKLYRAFSNRILWIDGDTVPGAFQMNTAWYFDIPARDPYLEAHVHDYDELIGFFGSDPDDPYNLQGEVEFAINGESRLLTRSTLIFCPKDIPHSPLRVLKVDKPIFHFSIVMNATYECEKMYR